MSRMLIADDQDGIRLMLAQVFQSLGIEVDTANDGQNAWEKLEQNGYDLVLLDMNMPRMFGHEVLRNMRQRDIDTPVMIMTALGKNRRSKKCNGLALPRNLRSRLIFIG
ncbi:response regulator [Exiguobacterium mexicanum]|uniref:response regulator n=1 Tax=Exiguobacterium mexicanum TaxID=340146 RepID=UPI0037BFC37C